MACILATPQKGLVDDEIKICIKGIGPRQEITVYASLKSESGDVFESRAFYAANHDGCVDLDTQPSLGGSYSGIEPMGLFWSMKPSPNGRRKYSRLIKQDVCTPTVVEICVFDGRVRGDTSTPPYLARNTVERWYKSEGVRRVPVRDGRLRGTMFIPDGEGPFPAVIDLFGTAGGLLEFRASLFASRGIVALALAYFDFEDLPDMVLDMELEYFEEAKVFLEQQPFVLKKGIGVVGVSVGGCLALAAATYIPGITCAVILNGLMYAGYTSFTYKGQSWQGITPDMNKMHVENNGMILADCWDVHEGDRLDKSLIHFQNSTTSFLMVFSGQDRALNSGPMRRFAERMLQSGSRCKCRMITYPGAGHLLEPPHTPHADITHTKLFNRTQRWGGKTREHARAQELCWKETLKFIRQELGIAANL